MKVFLMQSAKKVMKKELVDKQYEEYKKCLEILVKLGEDGVEELEPSARTQKNVTIKFEKWTLEVLKTLAGNMQTSLAGAVKILIMEFLAQNPDLGKPLHPRGFENAIVKGARAQF